MMRRSLARKPAAPRPYDRPRPSEGGASPPPWTLRGGDEDLGRGWLSKAKLLLRPASRILPSLSPFDAFPSYSKHLARPSGSSGAPPLEFEQDSNVDIAKQVFNDLLPGLTMEEVNSKTVEHDTGRLRNTYDGIGFTDIERWLKQRTFSRDESIRLIELLRSRTIDLPEGGKCQAVFTAHVAGNAEDPKNVRSSTKQNNPVQLNPRAHKEAVFDEVGASPVEIAKSFMESCSSASHQHSHSGIRRSDATPSCGHDSVANSSMSPVGQMPQICWPGAVVRADHGYFTSKSQRGRARLHKLLPMPCPEESFQSSISKFQCSRERGPNLPFTAWKQSPTPIFGANKKRISTPGDGQTAVLPMQRDLEHGSSGCNIFKHQAVCSENDSLKTAAGLSRVHPKSSEVARQIIEHIDRTIPSRQDKLFESKFLIEKKSLPPSGLTNAVNDQDNKLCPVSPGSSFLLGDNVISGNAEVKKNSLSLCQSFGSGCVSTAKSVSNAEQASSFPDNGSRFLFPASVASNAASKPLATPAVPLHSSSGVEGTGLSFTFGSSTVGSGQIFSFSPVGDIGSIRVAENSIPSYRFGSNNGSRLSFRSFGSDAVCY